MVDSFLSCVHASESNSVLNGCMQLVLFDLS